MNEDHAPADPHAVRVEAVDAEDVVALPIVVAHHEAMAVCHAAKHP